MRSTYLDNIMIKLTYRNSLLFRLQKIYFNFIQKENIFTQCALNRYDVYSMEPEFEVADGNMVECEGLTFYMVVSCAVISLTPFTPKI